MATKKAKLVDADGATITSEPATGGFGFSLTDIPVSLVVDLARMGVQLGIGLVAMAADAAQKVALEAIDRGAKIEKAGLKTLGEFEHEQVTYMKDYLRRVKGTAQPGGGSIEAHVEEALRTHDVPTRDDIRELNEQISALNDKVSKLHK
jgi:polyhydroxyalkanoate synthesis regulator phasin